MVSPEEQGVAPARRSRRAVRHAGTVGGDDAHLVSVHPALSVGNGVSSLEADAAGRARSVSRAGGLDRSADDTDLGWGEVDQGSNDERLTSDKPPHW